MNLNLLLLEHQTLKGTVNRALDRYFAGRLYYPSRVNYLNGVRDALARLDPAQRYIFLTMNSSIASQLILEKGGKAYDFSGYLEAFRDRCALGDMLVRLFCYPTAPGITRAQRRAEIQRFVTSHNLAYSVNGFLHRRQHFNCAYMIPLNDDSEAILALRNSYDELRGHRYSAHSWTNFNTAILKAVDSQRGIIFHELHDYDVAETDGVAYKCSASAEPSTLAGYVSVYSGALKEAEHISAPPILDEIEVFDFGLIVALPIELQAIRRQLERAKAPMVVYKTLGGVQLYRSYYYPKDRTVGVAIVIAMLPQTGNIASAVATSLLTEVLGVKNIVNVGISGGIEGQVQLGDVFVANTVVYYERQKQEAGKLSFDYRTYECSFDDVARAHSSTEYLGMMTRTVPADVTLPRSPMAHYDCALASGEKVVADSRHVLNIKGFVSRKLAGVECEAAGIYSTAKSSPGVKFVAIKGVSDYADSTKDDRWHEYAADAAAAYAFRLLAHQPLSNDG